LWSVYDRVTRVVLLNAKRRVRVMSREAVVRMRPNQTALVTALWSATRPPRSVPRAMEVL
jgi:hypothetical protein